MEVIEKRIVLIINDEHQEKQEFSMEVIEVGIVFDVHEEHDEKQ
jgi:hypothetical protein